MAETEILLESGTNELEILEFVIGMNNQKQSFGINVAKIREVILMPRFDEVPNSHPSVKGVFQLRGNVIPLIDLAQYLHGKKVEDFNKAKVIVTEFNKQNFGFLVDDVVSIHRMSWEEVLPPNEALSNQQHDCIVALIPIEEKTVMMLDFEKVVSEINPESSLHVEEAQDELADLPDRELSVLMADDSETMRSMISGLLRKGGFRVNAYSNGKEALEELMNVKGQVTEKAPITSFYDLVITDIEMPKMDGHSLCRKIKEDTVLGELPVILFSSLIYDELRKKGEALGADAQISKPELRSLVQIAKKLILQNSKKEQKNEAAVAA